MTIYKKIIVMPIEPIETRYTAQWYEHVPKILKENFPESDVIWIDGELTSKETTSGAFLNFAATNTYKSTQFATLSRMIESGLDDAYVLYTDAWNPTVIQLRYMIALLGLNITVGGLWHAGSYDKHDFLGRAAGKSSWALNSELAMFESFDHNFFATEFHADLFDAKYETMYDERKLVLAGWPMEYLESVIPSKVEWEDKEDIILFPHRIAPEKQISLFKELEAIMPDFKFIVCQDKKLTKSEYHDLLKRSKFIFSASLQETLGISWVEGLIAGCIPILPNRLSYAEMWKDLYDVDIELNDLAEFIRERNRHPVIDTLQVRRVLDTYFTSWSIISTIKGS